MKFYVEKCGISQIIDDYLHDDHRRKGLSHGQVCVAMITGIPFQIFQLYGLCKFAKAITVLDVILPATDSDQYLDGSLADTQDAIYDGGNGNPKTLLTHKRLKDGKR